jgi:multiple sugar transport system permease protein
MNRQAESPVGTPAIRPHSALSDPDRPPANSESRRVLARSAISNLVLAAIGLLFLSPMLWLAFASLDSHATWSIEWPHFTLSNFHQAVTANNLQSLVNSLILAGVSTAIATVCGAMAAYGLSRRRIPFKGPLLLFVLFLSGVPLSILIVPIFQMFASVGYLSILPTAVFLAVTSLPFEIYLMKNFIDAVPPELEEAARMERASTLQVLTRVVVPLAMPGIAAAAIFGFVNAWGSFIVPLVLITSPSQEPGPVAIFGFIGAANVRYGDIAAYSLVFAVPVFLLYALSSRLFREGFVLGGGIKG